MKLKFLIFIMLMSCILNASPIQDNRILSLVPSNTELLFSMGFGSKIVGVSTYCNYPQEVLKLPKVGGLSLNMEKIVSLRPTVVIDLNSMHKRYHTMFCKLGINYVDFKIASINDIPKIAVEMAKLLGDKSKGISFQNHWNESLMSLELEIKLTKLKVYFEVWDAPMQAAGPNSFIGNMISIAGGKNIIKSNTDFPTVNSEQIVKANPDIIFLAYPAKDTMLIKNRAGWSNLQPIINDKIFLLDQDLFVRPGPRNIEGLKILRNYLLSIQK